MKTHPLLLVCMLFLTACVAPAAALPTSSAAPSRTVSSPAKTKTPFQDLATNTPVLPTATQTITPTLTPTLTDTPTVVPTFGYPLAGRGPTNFGDNVDPLTGMTVADSSILNRRPVMVKVENLPRIHRPQWGLSLADMVYEYYTEQGTTRFAAIYYGQDAKMVAPIRSGRFFDSNIVQMYKSFFIFGSAYTDVMNSFYASDFAKRLILESAKSCPPVCRFSTVDDLLKADTGALNAYVRSLGLDNSRQNLDGMFFKTQPPTGGDTASQVYVRFSGAIYNRWDYNPLSGQYLRFSDTQDDVDHVKEVYAQLTDRQNGLPIVADNVVMICVPHEVYTRTSNIEVLKMPMAPGSNSSPLCDGKLYSNGSGPAYVARDGKLYPVTWKRKSVDSVLTLVNSDGSPFPLKPGQTWFEVLSQTSKIVQQGDAWRFTFGISW